MILEVGRRVKPVHWVIDLGGCFDCLVAFGLSIDFPSFQVFATKFVLLFCYTCNSVSADNMYIVFWTNNFFDVSDI